MAQKKKIYYARTYRRLRINPLNLALYFGLLVLPVLVIFLMNIENLTEMLAWLAVRFMSDLFPGIPVQIVSGRFSVFGNVDIVELPTVYPEIGTVLWNLLVLLVLSVLVASGRRAGKPLSIYLMIGLIIHGVNCIYFVFATNSFPYSAHQYSDLYMKQQIGIWMVFIVLTGMVTGCVGRKGLRFKILAFGGTLAYSFVFGCVRYLLFLYIIERFSVLYMALMFFVFGPFFDFVYLVGIYAVFLNQMGKLYDSQKGKEEWMWS